MSRIYFYKMTGDDGGAPCAERGVLTLAICKPQIRKKAEVGDFVIGFAAKSLHAGGAVVYAARVGEKLGEGDYYRDARFLARRDRIYQWLNGRLVLRADARHHHGSGRLEHDVGRAPEHDRANVLVSRQFVYWGGNATTEYKIKYPAMAKAVEALNQGHRVNHGEELMRELRRFLKKHLPAKGGRVLGKPTSGAERGDCSESVARKAEC